MHKQSCIVRIRSKLKDLTETERKVADYVLEHYDEVVNLTISEFADRSGVSDATVVRFCKSIGYKGYQAFKISLAQNLIEPYRHINQALEEKDSLFDIARKMFAFETQAINETLNILDIKTLEQAVNHISGAKSLSICGSGGSYTVAFDIQQKFLKIGIRCDVYGDSHNQLMSASLLKEGDVLIGISSSGSNRDIIECMKTASKNGAVTIGITVRGKSPLMKVCDFVLLSGSQETAFHSESVAARTAQLVLLDTVVAAVGFRNSKRSYEAIQKTREATSSRKY